MELLASKAEGPSMVIGDALHQIDLGAGAAANRAIPAVADGPVHVPVEKILKRLEEWNPTLSQNPLHETQITQNIRWQNRYVPVVVSIYLNVCQLSMDDKSTIIKESRQHAVQESTKDVANCGEYQLDIHFSSMSNSLATKNYQCTNNITNEV